MEAQTLELRSIVQLLRSQFMIAVYDKFNIVALIPGFHVPVLEPVTEVFILSPREFMA